MPTQIMNTKAFTAQEQAALALAQDDPEQVPCVDQFSGDEVVTMAQVYLKNGPVPALKLQIPGPSTPTCNRNYGISTQINAPSAVATWMQSDHPHPLRSFASSNKWYMPMALWAKGGLYGIIPGNAALNFDSLGLTGAYVLIEYKGLHKFVYDDLGLTLSARDWADGLLGLPFWASAQNEGIEAPGYHPDNAESCVALVDQLRGLVHAHTAEKST